LTLKLETFPPGAQAYVDGYFVGMLADANGQLLLDAGPHQIAVQAPGWKPLEFGVKIFADRSITYEGALEKLAGAVTLTQPAVAPSTIYFIPGCYLGNVPPQRSALPASCDIGRLTTYKQ
jgi:hypothetical protein